MDKRDYDVIIAGGGLAGLACADQLKYSGLSILILEKERLIKEKVCGGALSGLCYRFDLSLPDSKKYFGHIFSLNNKEHLVYFKRPFRSISRSELAVIQYERIKACPSITVLDHTALTGIDEHTVKTDRGEFTFRYLVGADGASSLVRKHLGLSSRIFLAICCKVPVVRYDFRWILEPDILKTGYLWMFPHEKHTNIGVYFDPAEVEAGIAKDFLKDYLCREGYAFSEADLKSGPINCLYTGYMFGNIFLAGDAAGLSLKITGEGIPFALISGREIAKKIINRDYDMPELRSILALKKRKDLLAELYAKLPVMRTGLLKSFIYLLRQVWFQTWFGL